MIRPQKIAHTSRGAAPSSETKKSPSDHALHTRADRFRALASVWKALRTSGLGTGSMHLGETCAELRDYLSAVARTGANADALSRLDDELDSFELGMRDVACNVPTSTLRTTLPGAAKRDRASVLELLDVMLVSDSGTQKGELGSRLTAVDYLITLLCADGDGNSASIRHDPVTLTPKLQMLCQNAEASGNPTHRHAEATFYSAAQSAPAGSFDTNELEKQKAELGSEFFAPRILRAITTYNASRLAGPGTPDTPRSKTPPSETVRSLTHNPSASVFETTALLPLIEALRRRVTGLPQTQSAVDRVAWCLDLDFATPSETSMMLQTSDVSPEKPAGGAVLVGLLCRAIDVLGDKLLAVGISPDVLSSDWTTELGGAIKIDVNQRILHNGYAQACALSDLQSKFLDFDGCTAPDASPPRSPTPLPVDGKKKMQRGASPKAKPALDAPAKPVIDRSDLRAANATRSRLFKMAGASGAALALVAALLFYVSAMPEGKVALSSNELTQISEHLVRAQRDGDGSGPSFVGTLNDSWGQLDGAERQSSAIDMVATLRLLGAQKIMIYDGMHRIRVQAIGEGNVHVPAVADAAH